MVEKWKIYKENNMLDLKADPEVPFHYIIGVAMRNITERDPGIIYLKYGPVFFTHEDILKVKMASELVKDKIYTEIYKMRKTEIYDLAGCSELIFTITSLHHAAKINMCTLHHFSSEYELPDADKFFSNMVKRANRFKKEKKQLNDSRI